MDKDKADITAFFTGPLGCLYSPSRYLVNILNHLWEDWNRIPISCCVLPLIQADNLPELIRSVCKDSKPFTNKKKNQATLNLQSKQKQKKKKKNEARSDPRPHYQLACRGSRCSR